MDSTTRISVRAGDLAPALAVRVTGPADVSLTARRDLGRYYALLNAERSVVDGVLSVHDLAAIMRVHAGARDVTIAGLISSLTADVEQRRRSTQRLGLYGTSDPIDSSLPCRVADMSPLQQAVLLDAIDRAWLSADESWEAALGIAPAHAAH